MTALPCAILAIALLVAGFSAVTQGKGIGRAARVTPVRSFTITWDHRRAAKHPLVPGFLTNQIYALAV